MVNKAAGPLPRRDFDGWYEAEHPRLVATFTLAAGNREVGREVAAETLARAFERWDRVGAMESPGGWAYRVGLNLVRRGHRQRTTEHRANERFSAGAALQSLPDESIELWDAVAALPRQERAAVGLRYGAALTEPEIADVLGIAVGTVSATLNHARAHLRVALGEPIEEVSHG